MLKAVIDRFEQDVAILLIGDEQIKLDLPRRYLPREAQEGHILHLELRIDQAGTDAQREMISRRMKRLLKRGPGQQP